MSTDEVFLYLTTTGRVSGLPREIEIWFVIHDDDHFIVSEKRDQAHWLKNIRKDPRVHFSIGTRANREAVRARTAGHADVPTAADTLAAVGSLMEKKYEWSNGLIVRLRTTKRAA